MNVTFRCILDKIFTIMTYLTALLIVILLLIVLSPMLWKGTSAVIFRETIEFRKMQLALFNRGNEAGLAAETAQTAALRQTVYETLDRFKSGIDTESLIGQVKDVYRQFGEQLRSRELPKEEFISLRSLTKDIRDRLETAFTSSDRTEVIACLDYAAKFSDDPRLKNTYAENFFRIASNYRKNIENIDLDRLHQNAKDAREAEELIVLLLGPRPGTPLPSTAMNQFGATRMDMADQILDKLLNKEQWVEQGPGLPLVKVRTERAKQFARTELEPVFSILENNFDGLMRPQWRFYWQYFIDDSTPGHYFGGVGPEILGTLLLTVISMLFAAPIGIIAAAYLTECASDNVVIKIIRMCINTLAGVPSIVFGLFGLTFFVLFFLPLIGLPSRPCIIAASLTLTILTLPVMIRASEEAIRSVPHTYKEASLAMGAGTFKTFVSVTLPAAMPGILTGIILSISRVAGETVPVLFTGAVALGPVPSSVLQQTRTLSYGSYDMAVSDRVSSMVPHNQYGMVATLVVLILCLNIVAIVLRSRVFKKLHGH
jgi:phosphate transport system permease protein